MSYSSVHSMNSQLFFWISLFFTIKLLLLVVSPLCSSRPDKLYNPCVASFNCGTITGVGYPFRREEDPSYCGYPGLVLNCNYSNTPSINIMNLTYRILDLNPTSQILKIVREDMIESPCPEYFTNTTINRELFDFPKHDMINLTLLYGCRSDFKYKSFSTLNCGGKDVPIMIDEEGSPYCKTSMLIPVSLKDMTNQVASLTDWGMVFQKGFEVRWKVDSTACSNCIGSNKSCIYSFDKRRTTCASPSPGSAMNGKSKNIIGLGAAGFGLFIICCMFLFISKRCEHNDIMKRRTKNDRNIEAFIVEYGSSTPKRYTYSEIKKMTVSFQEKLGQGGFGSVFKGKLSDDRLVAVKVFNSFKGNGEEFINEVGSISRTSHVNIVSLLGFCYDRQRSALIYEFMPNGSLERFIHRDVPLTNNQDLGVIINQELGVKRLYEIALGIARGLEYLHDGCNARILHLDIKPHNILLDEDFLPKIADFGLAKLYSRKETVVSMLEARGTIGYIAPEVLMRNIGRVSHKSDVYSYGMMILDMVGGRKNVNAGVDHTSDIYSPHWIYKCLEENDLKLEGLETVGGDGFIRKMILVGLWCIQIQPSQRPSMSKVIELLEGRTEAIQVPPKPLFFSPPRSPETTSATSAS